MAHVLGKTEDEIRQLYERGALGKWADVPTRRPPPGWDGKAGLRMSMDLSRHRSEPASSGSRQGKKERAANKEQTVWTDWIKERDNPRIAHTKAEALDDITVLDLSDKSFAGCYCSSLLAELGAKVLRIEPPEGDFIRTCTPYGMLYKGEGLNYLTEGRNKFHITLNLKEPEGREILKALAGKADVLIETYRPGVMDGWGIGYEQLKKINPGLIFASITGYGQFGAMSRSRMPDYDNIAQARSGVQSATGEVMPEGKSYDECPWAVPTKAGPWIGWCQPGTFMAVGILAALHWRELSDPLLGNYLDHEFPVMMSKTPPRVEWSVRPVGFDNEYIMAHVLGKTEDEIRQLYERGALGKWADVPTRRPPPGWDGKAGLRMSMDLSRHRSEPGTSGLARERKREQRTRNKQSGRIG